MMAAYATQMDDEARERVRTMLGGRLLDKTAEKAKPTAPEKTNEFV